MLKYVKFSNAHNSRKLIHFDKINFKNVQREIDPLH